MKSKKILFGLIVVGAVAVTSLVLIEKPHDLLSLPHQTNTSDYSLTLDSSNSVSSDGNVKQKTDSLKNDVTFTYTNISSPNSGMHTALKTGGSLVNLDQLTSINTFEVKFTGTLKYRWAKADKVWSSYDSLYSGLAVSINNAYYLEINATLDTQIEKIIYRYSCLPNIDTDDQVIVSSYKKLSSDLTDYTGDYLFVYEEGSLALNSSLTTMDTTNNGRTVTIIDNEIKYDETTEKLSFSVSKFNTGYSIKSASGSYIGCTVGSSINGLNLSTTEILNTFTHKDIVSNSHHLVFNSSATQMRFRYYKATSYQNQQLIALYKKVETIVSPIQPTAISLNESRLDLAPGQSSQLSVSYTPNNANTSLDIIWSSDNLNVATVDTNGLVKVSNSATEGQTASITATLKSNDNIKISCLINVCETQKDAWTILIYMCGSDLESANGLASMDLQEMLSVKNQPEDVNIIIQTGGASSWENTYGISSSKLSRYYISNQKLNLIETLPQANMGASTTCQDFLEWGLTNYPAQKTGFIFWNHGGALDGICSDENFNNDSLLNSEVKTAFTKAYENVGLSNQKLEFIGYDACLMAVQEVAYTNSSFFNYMVCSQESESGYGWKYDGWLDDLYQGKETTVILEEICTTFISDCNSYGAYDQTLSVLDLSKMEKYKTALEDLATALYAKITSSIKMDTFEQNIVNTCMKFGYSDEEAYYSSIWNYGYIFDVFDVGNLAQKLKTNTTYAVQSQATALENALNEVVIVSKYGSQADGASGLCYFFPVTKDYYKISFYNQESSFTNWGKLCFKY